MLRVECNDMPMTQKGLYTQRLQIHEGRSHDIELDKSLFDPICNYIIYVYDMYDLWYNLKERVSLIVAM